MMDDNPYPAPSDSPRPRVVPCRQVQATLAVPLGGEGGTGYCIGIGPPVAPDPAAHERDEEAVALPGAAPVAPANSSQLHRNQLVCELLEPGRDWSHLRKDSGPPGLTK